MSTYEDHAYARSTVAYLQRMLIERGMTSDSPPKDPVICEEVRRSESVVPQEHLQRILDKLQLWENDEREKMNRFRMTEIEPPPFLKDNKAGKNDESAKQGKAKRSKKPPPPPAPPAAS